MRPGPGKGSICCCCLLFQFADLGILQIERRFHDIGLCLEVFRPGLGIPILLLKLIDSFVGARADDVFDGAVNQDESQQR